MYLESSQMYIDDNLVKYIDETYGEDDWYWIKELIENCGIWYTEDGIRALEEDFDKPLSEILADYYYVIDKNKMLFCPPDKFADDVIEYI